MLLHCLPMAGTNLVALGGGLDTWTIYNTGVQVLVEYMEDKKSSSSSSATATPTTTSDPEKTLVVTASPTNDTETEEDSGGGKNVAGIAAGVVVAVVVVAALIGGGFIYMRRKRNKEIEEEHRRNAAVNAFIGRSPSSSGGTSMSDARLDPVLAHRRMSDGSIADNQDYSRRILRVRHSFCDPFQMAACANKPRSPMHDCTTPVMTTNELTLIFTFDSSSITGVLGKGGRVGEDILRVFSHTWWRIDHTTITRMEPTWGVFSFRLYGQKREHVRGCHDWVDRGRPRVPARLLPLLRYNFRPVPGPDAVLYAVPPASQLLSERATCSINGDIQFLQEVASLCVNGM